MAVTDKFRAASSSGRAVVTSLSLAKAAGATSASLVAATNWPAVVDFVMYRRQLNTTTGLYEEISGTRVEGRADVSGTTLFNIVIDEGTEPASGYAADGNTVVMPAATARWGNDMVAGITTSLDQDGTLKNGAVDVAAVLAPNVVTTSAIVNGSVDADKLGLGGQAAFVATDQTTTSTSYADLATTTDTVTVTIGANGAALVSLASGIFNSGANDTFVGFAISGATTTAATDAMCIRQATSSAMGLGATFLITGLTAGSTTFKMKYRVSAGTGHAFNRRIAVVPL